MPRFLIKYEIRQIQKYIYASSKIKEIVGASEIVQGCLFSFLMKACEEMNLRHNIQNEYDKLDSPFKFDDNLDFQIGYEGGGNLACFLTGDEKKVKEFNRKVGFLFLKETYSLRVCYSYVEVHDDFQIDRKQLDEKLSRLKVTMPMTNLHASLPIVMTSMETSLPLSEKEKKERGRKITKDSYLKLKKYQSEFNENNGSTFIDEFIEKNVDSYIAIVHIDANDLGTAITSFFKDKNEGTYEEKVDLSRQVSKKIKENFNRRFDEYLNSFVERKRKEGKDVKYRIIVNSGDDITFILSNNYAIELVKGFLEEINKYSFFDNEIKISACAGIAFVKSHFPYDRGYEIAEEICESAKKEAKSKIIRDGNNGQSRCAFDYFICQNGIITTVENDEAKFKRLYCKPYFVNRNCGAINDCETLFKRLRELNDESNNMSLGKAKQIRNVYEKNEQATVLLFKGMSSRLNKPLDEPFIDGKASYYDASTLIDFVDMSKAKGE